MRVVNVNTDSISGILTYPENISSNLPAVLLLHGFAADKNEVNDAYMHLAEKLAAHGVVSLRIDFRGDAENKIFSIRDMIADAKIAHEYLSQLPEINSEKIGVVGFSLGSTVALLLSQQAFCHSLTLLSPTLNLPNDFTGALHTDTMEKIANCEEFHEVDLEWKKVNISKAFYKSLFDCNPSDAAESFSGNLLCIAGANDFSAPNAQQIDENSPHTQHKETIIISDGDHIFSKNMSDVIKKTAEWMACSMRAEKRNSCGMR